MRTQFNIVVCVLASLAFSISTDFLKANDAKGMMVAIAIDIISTVTFPLAGTLALLNDPAGALSVLANWALSVNANLFKLSKVIAVILWMLAIGLFIQRLLLNAEYKIDKRPMCRNTMTMGEVVRFFITALLASCVAALVWISFHNEEAGSSRAAWELPLLGAFFFFCFLWFALLLSRKET